MRREMIEGVMGNSSFSSPLVSMVNVSAGIPAHQLPVKSEKLPVSSCLQLATFHWQMANRLPSDGRVLLQHILDLLLQDRRHTHGQGEWYQLLADLQLYFLLTGKCLQYLLKIQKKMLRRTRGEIDGVDGDT